MTKSDLIKAIAADTHMIPGHVEQILDGLARVTSKHLAEGDDVTIPGLVKLAAKQRAARKGRNPGTGEAIDIPAKTVVSAKPVKALSEFVA